MRFPDKFINEMDAFFARHEDIPAEGFYDSFDIPGRKGIRFSTMKTDEASRKELSSMLCGSSEKVSWCSCGYYAPGDISNRNPYYHAGVYYPQEPSAMLPAEVINAKPGEVILDMCAAPGGKACRIGEDLKGEGLLVANEINFDRSKALLRNIERSGITGVIILNENPQNIAKVLPGFFDKILIDAPCSGEGMFRRDPGAIKSYEEYGPDNIAPIQREILDYADIALKEGGEIVYSTCTFCEDENEAQIKAFMERHPGYEVIAHPEIEGVTQSAPSSVLPGSMRIWPHLNPGDGHFCVHLKKKGVRTPSDMGSFIPRGLKASSREGVEAARGFLSDILSDTGLKKFEGKPFAVHGQSIFLMDFDEKIFRGLKTVKTGLYIGDFKKAGYKTVFTPSNSISLSFARSDIRQDSYLELSADSDRILRYLKGETVSLGDDGASLKNKGFTVIGAGDYPVGLGKVSGGTIKNLYPKAWRIV
ncbi:MAG: RsmB/NOP family class I SAM-dependent RNA methyltransferase [Saccharofermentans sp.]|nr:RsmB/NOP family class I SAM-dependent RNA methyltransferase [Saccharofermentans sp.]